MDGPVIIKFPEPKPIGVSRNELAAAASVCDRLANAAEQAGDRLEEGIWRDVAEELRGIVLGA